MSDSEIKQTKECGQCGRPAIGAVGGVPVCVECYTRLQNAHTAEMHARMQMIRHNMAMMNYATAQMDSIVGLPGLTPRVQIPSMPATGPVTATNHIKIDNSVVGASTLGLFTTST
jgi:hypothetical protein